jgi:uncharacterized protein
MRFKAAVFLPLLLLPSAAHADPFGDAKAAYDRKDYQTALKLLKPLADKGEIKAQFALGVMYGNGDGVTKNYSDAEKWFRKAADQGSADAQKNIGGMYEYGEGVKQDYSSAVQWFRKAAEQGDAEAQVDLGKMYYRGEGVEKDMVQAYLLFSLAKAAGSHEAAGWLDLSRGIMTPEQTTQAKRLVAEWKKSPSTASPPETK